MKKLIIVGAGVAGKDVLKETLKSPEMNLRVVGFIDDDPIKKGLKVDGIKVLGTSKDLVKVAKSKRVDEVIIAIPSAQGKQISEYVKICSNAKITFRIVPRVKEIIEGKAELKNLRKVRIEDLLGRPVVKEGIQELKAFFENKKVLVTGAAGSIGSELSSQIAAYNPKEVVLLDWWENGMFNLQMELDENFPKANKRYVIGSVQDKNKINRVMKTHMPDYVFHAAAYKHVPVMEENPLEAVKNNIFGTLNVVKAAKRVGVKKFVFVSTDKAANPVNVMGATKLVAEGIVKKANGKSKFSAVRFGNVLDSFGSVVPIFKKQIENGGPVTVTDKKMTRYFMTIPEAVQLILKAALIGEGGELFVLDMGKPVKIYDLAENIIRLSGFVPYKDVKIAITGPRKGEKLTEKLFTDKEKLIVTKEKKIFVTESLGLKVTELPQLLTRLRTVVKREEESKVRKELGKIIEGF